MTDNSEKFSGKQEKALAALLNNPTVREAAKEANVSEPTLYRYLREQASDSLARLLFGEVRATFAQSVTEQVM